MKWLLLAACSAIEVAAFSSIATAEVRDHRGTPDASPVRDHRDTPDATPVRDHRDTPDATPVRDHRDEPSPSPSPSPPAPSPPEPTQGEDTSLLVAVVDATVNAIASDSDVQQEDNGVEYRAAPIHWPRARIEITSFLRRVNAIDNAAGLGLQISADITSNLYVGIEGASGVPVDQMATTAKFAQGGLVAGVRGKVTPSLALGVEAALELQSFRDVNTVLDLRIKAEKQLSSHLSLGVYGGRNVFDGGDMFAGIHLAFHSAR